MSHVPQFNQAFENQDGVHIEERKGEELDILPSEPKITPYLDFYHAGSQTQNTQLEFSCDTSNLSWEDLEEVCP